MSSILEIQTPRAFVPLLRPSRYRGAHGGRGSGKSHFFAEMLVERCLMERGHRAVCLREIQKSLEQSVKRLIEDKIRTLGVEKKFRILDKYIEAPGDGLIIFQGMQTHTADSIKSLEGFKTAWVEEAQSLSEYSLRLLRPTLRAPGSELWFTWNPASAEDPVDLLLRGPGAANDPGMTVIQANWRDNPWFPAELGAERLRDKERNPDTYGHVWEGDYLTISDAVVFRNRVSVESFDTPSDARFFFGADFGFAVDPSTLVRFWIRDECLYIDHEAYGAGVEIDNMPAMYDRLPGARKWPIKADGARPETISYLSRQGFKISAAEKWPGSIEDGIAHMKGFKRIIVHERCPNTAREFRLYSYKVDRHTSDILPVLRDDHNHAIDAIRYGLDGYIRKRTAAAVQPLRL